MQLKRSFIESVSVLADQSLATLIWAQSRSAAAAAAAEAATPAGPPSSDGYRQPNSVYIGADPLKANVGDYSLRVLLWYQKED